MSTKSVVFALISAAFLLVHMMGGIKPIMTSLDLAFELRDMPYVLAIPGMAALTLYLLKV